MIALTCLRTVQVEHAPERLEPGVIYVSEKYGAALHLCPCGCGNEVVTPFGDEGWTLTIEADGSATLAPSLGNYGLACRSHYFVQQGKVVWA